jgi:hypothetical protein
MKKSAQMHPLFETAQNELGLTNQSEPGLGQVQLAFDTTQNLIINAALVAKTNGGLTLDVQCFEKELDKANSIRYVFPGSFAELQARQPLAIVPGQLFIERGAFFNVLFLGIFQMGDGRFNDNASRFPFLTIQPAGSSQAEGADDRWKRAALQYERRENYAECEKNNQSPIGKRAAICE